jgi:hypothetical protein
MFVHALHTMHALPDLRIVAGRLRDGVSTGHTMVVLMKLGAGAISFSRSATFSRAPP